MTQKKQVDIFHVGPEKTGTTWIYECLRDHPEICASIKDKTHYYDMHYHRGWEWYKSRFGEGFDTLKVFDPTPSYLHSKLAPRRIANDNPDAKIIITLRHPIERAFSHYWHSKKKFRYDYDFSEILKRYWLFQGWLEPGFYAEHIETYMNYFPKENILCLLFDDLEKDPAGFLRRICEFTDINPEYTPEIIGTKVNEKKSRESETKRSLRTVLDSLGLLGVARTTMAIMRKTGLIKGDGPFRQHIEKLSHVDRSVINELNKICMPEIERLEKLLDMDLTIWRRYDS